MNSNRDLLKEAIADAKAVKETAIANAKAALEESFGPFLREKLAMKLEELDNLEENELAETELAKENYLDEDSFEEDPLNPEENLEENPENLEELDLEELLRELDGLEEDEVKKEMNEVEGEETDETYDEDINIEDMSAEDLKNFIESVIADMVEAGELEAGEGMEGEEEGEKENKEEMMDEVDLEELMADVATGEKTYENYGLEEAKRKAARAKMKREEAEEEKEEAKRKAAKAEKELKEAYDTIEAMQSTLNEVNLLNAKLLYTNKIFKSKSLTESQKVKVLTAFDKATSKKEAQLVYETLLEGLKEKKTSINESMLGGASKVIGGPAPKQPIIEVNNQFARWQKLAGIK